MAEFTVTVTIDLADGRTLTKTRTVTIPPAYEERDILRLYSYELEHTAEELIEDQNHPDWVPPRLKAMLVNDARLVGIEELVPLMRRRGHNRSADDVQTILELHEDAVLARWGSDPIEES